MENMEITFENIFNSILFNNKKEDLDLANAIFPNGFKYKRLDILKFKILGSTEKGATFLSNSCF